MARSDSIAFCSFHPFVVLFNDPTDTVFNSLIVLRLVFDTPFGVAVTWEATTYYHVASAVLDLAELRIAPKSCDVYIFKEVL